MVAGLVLPDMVGAVIALLQEDPDVAALCGKNVPAGYLPRVASALPEVPTTDPRHWFMPDYAVLIRRAGGRGADVYSDLHYGRIDVRCFGPGDSINMRRRNADELWRTVHPVLSPPSPYRSSYQAKRTIIHSIVP